jgi:hypothetical protein
LELLPLPIWIRREDISLSWLNPAAAALKECDAHVALAEQREPFTGALGEDGRWLAEQCQLDGEARSEMAPAVTAGESRLYSVTQLPSICRLRQSDQTILPAAAKWFTVSNDPAKARLRRLLKQAGRFFQHGSPVLTRPPGFVISGRPFAARHLDDMNVVNPA